MNAVLQVFLNSNELKNIFLHENFNRTINYQNKFGFKGKVILEFLKLLKEKWLDDSKTITPRQWKELIGEINSQFKEYDQQDANDFLNFMLDALHEEINLKSEKIFIPNPEYYNGTEKELAIEYWSNNLRRNVSFIHSLFLGQLKSTLTCMKCGTEKISFECFSSLNVPIPQKSTIFLEVILHRLPFTFKIYYDKMAEIFLKIKSIYHADNLKFFLFNPNITKLMDSYENDIVVESGFNLYFFLSQLYMIESEDTEFCRFYAELSKLKQKNSENTLVDNNIHYIMTMKFYKEHSLNVEIVKDDSLHRVYFPKLNYFSQFTKVNL